MTNRAGQSIAWTSADLPSQIGQGAYASTFSYTPARGRWKQVASYNGTTETTTYLGGLVEKVQRGAVTEYRHYIPAGAGSMAIHTRRSGASPASSTYYVTGDHLGSATTVMDEAGASLANLSFAALGSRRRASWQDQLLAEEWAPITATTRRGFTGHEHLDNLSLIHMNGRVYDPKLGRFLSADPVWLGDPAAPQSLNPYSYVGNNPLSATDPSGFVSDDNSIYVFCHHPCMDSRIDDWDWVFEAMARDMDQWLADSNWGPGSPDYDGSPSGSESESDKAMTQTQKPQACKAIGYAASTVAGATAAGAAAGLMQGSPLLAVGLAVAGFAAGVAQVVTEPRAGQTNATQVAAGVAVGGLAGAAIRGGSSPSGAIAGGVVGGLFSGAGAPNWVSGFEGGAVSGFGISAGTISALGANMLRGGAVGLVAGTVGDLANQAGRALTGVVCK